MSGERIVAVFGDRLVQLAYLEIAGTRGATSRAVGLEPDRRAEFGDGLVELALIASRDVAEVAVGRGDVGRA